MSDFQQWAEADSAPWTKVNENLDALAGASLYAHDVDSDSGLTYGYMGGVFKDSTKVAGTVALTNNATNYIVAALTGGAVSAATATTNWNDSTNYARVAKVVTASGSISSVVDYRFDQYGLFSALSTGVGGGGTGSDGDQLQGLVFTSDTGSTADSDPGNGLFKWNNATQSSATQLYFDNQTADGVSVTEFWSDLPSVGFIYLQQADDSTRWQLWQWTAVTLAAGYFKLTVNRKGVSSNAIQDDKAVFCDFDANPSSGGGTPAGSDKQVQYNASSSFGAESGFEYDPSTNTLSVPYIFLGDGAGDANSLSGDDLHWFNVTNNPSSGAGKQLMRVNSYGASGYGGNVHFCRYRGTLASPSAVQSGDTFMSFGMRGWDSGGALSQSAASFAAVATENWTGSAHGIKWVWQVTPNGSTTRGNGMELASTGLTVTGDIGATGKILNTESIIIAASDETTAITATTGKVTFRMPYAFTLSAVRASLTTAQSSGSIFTVDINEAGSTILSTKLTIDNTEKTSTTAATPPVISDASLADDAEITIDVDQIGDGTAKGLKIYLIGKKA